MYFDPKYFPMVSMVKMVEACKEPLLQSQGFFITKVCPVLGRIRYVVVFYPTIFIISPFK